MTSVANERDMPYLKSSQVIALPSCHFTPSLIVNFHSEESALGVPVSVARSATGVLASSGLVDVGNVTRLRYTVRPKLERSRPMYMRCGSRCSDGEYCRKCSVPPALAGPDALLLLSLVEPPPQPARLTATTAAAATPVARFRMLPI